MPILDDMISVGILGAFAIFVYAGLRGISMKEAIQHVIEFLKIEEEEE